MEDSLKKAVALTLKSGASQAEAFGSRTRALHATFEKKQLKTIESKNDTGIGVRALILSGNSSSLGSSFSMSASGEALEKAATDAVSVARNRKPELVPMSLERDTRRTERARLVDRKVKEMGMAGAASLASRLINAAATERRIRSVSGEVVFSYYETFYSNSLGVQRGYDGTVFSATVWVTAKQSNSVGSAYDGYASRFYEPGPTVKVASETAKMAIDQLKPKTVKAGKMQIIMGPEALEGLTGSVLGPALRADFVQKNQSPLAGKIGQVIGSEQVSLDDDGTVPRFVGSKPSDDEGHIVKKRSIVEKGRLVTYLHNHKTTSTEGEDKGGNAVRVSSPDMMRKYAGEPQILPHNLLVNPGRYSLDDLIGEVKEGIYTKSLIGAHTANRVTGEFSVVPQMAYKISNGNIDYPIKDTVLSGNFLDVLRNFVAAGRDATHVPSISGDSSLTSPPILVEGLSISG